MVDSINSNQNAINADLALQAGQSNASTQVGGVDTSASSNSNQTKSLFNDQADISDTAYRLLQSQAGLTQFSRQAMATEEPTNPLVASLKDMFDSGRINQYLSGVSNSDLASSLMNNGPVAAFLS